jgi:hypothetical protein
MSGDVRETDVEEAKAVVENKRQTTRVRPITLFFTGNLFFININSFYPNFDYHFYYRFFVTTTIQSLLPAFRKISAFLKLYSSVDPYWHTFVTDFSGFATPLIV